MTRRQLLVATASLLALSGCTTSNSSPDPSISDSTPPAATAVTPQPADSSKQPTAKQDDEETKADPGGVNISQAELKELSDAALSGGYAAGIGNTYTFYFTSVTREACTDCLANEMLGLAHMSKRPSGVVIILKGRPSVVDALPDKPSKITATFMKVNRSAALPVFELE